MSEGFCYSIGILDVLANYTPCRGRDPLRMLASKLRESLDHFHIPHQDSRRRKEHCCFKAGENKTRRTKQPDTLNALLDTQETTMNTLITSTNLSRLISTAIFGVLTLSWGAMSIAADESDAPQAVVKFGDLNLSNPQGAAALYHRIWSAAVTVCRPQDDGSLASMSRVQTCVHKAIADAVTKVDRAELFAVYNAKSRQLRPIVVAQGR